MEPKPGNPPSWSPILPRRRFSDSVFFPHRPPWIPLCFIQAPCGGTASVSNNDLAAHKSSVAKPSVNHAYKGANTRRAARLFPSWCQSRAKLTVARSSSDFACCCWAISIAFRKHTSASWGLGVRGWGLVFIFDFCPLTFDLLVAATARP